MQNSAWERGTGLAEKAKDLAQRGKLQESHDIYIAALEECMNGVSQTFDRMTRKKNQVSLEKFMREAEDVTKRLETRDQFHPATVCIGHKKGFKFQMGRKGLGWYVDSVARRAEAMKSVESTQTKNADNNYKSARHLATKAVEYDKERDFKNAYECYRKCVDFYHVAHADASSESRKKAIAVELAPFKRRAEELGTFLKKATYWSYTGDGINRSDKASSRYDDAVYHAKNAVKADAEGRYGEALASYTCACEDFLAAIKFRIVPKPALPAVKDRIRGYMKRAETLKEIVEADPARFEKSKKDASDVPTSSSSSEGDPPKQRVVPRFPGLSENSSTGGTDDVTLESLEARFKDLSTE